MIFVRRQSTDSYLHKQS